MMLFDALTSYGPYPHRPSQEPWRLTQLLENLDQYGIHAALVRHSQSIYHDAMQGNIRLIAEIEAQRRRLFPCFVVGPHHCGDFPTPANLAAILEANEVRAVQLCPKRHGYPVHAAVLGELAAMLNAERLPVFVSMAEIGNDYEVWEQLAGLLHECPLVMTDAGWGELRFVDACMRRCDNLHLTFSRLQANRAVEWFADRYGVEHCLFGSGLPQMSAGAARGFVDWSMLEAAAQAQFAGGNLARLLGVPPPAGIELPAPPGTISLAAQAGRPMPITVLDAHAHVLEYGGCGVGAGYVMPKGDATGILEVCDRCGIAGIAMMTWQGPCGLDAVAGNELMTRIAAGHRARIIGLSSVDPLHQTQQELLGVLTHCHLELGFRGIKPYWPQNGIPYNAPAYSACWEFADRYGLYALLHTSGDKAGVDAVVDTAQHFPRATFLIAHSGGSWGYAELVADACRTCPNIYAELTLTPVPNGIVEWLCEHAGVERVLFGSDMPMRDPRPQLGWVVHSRLEDAAKRLVLGGNFSRILQRATLPGYSLPAVFAAGGKDIAPSGRAAPR